MGISALNGTSSAQLQGATIAPFIAPAMAAPAPAATASASSSTGASGLSSALGNIQQGLQSNSATGDLQSGLGIASLLNKTGAAGSAIPQVSGALGAIGGGLGVYNGLQQGGISGYGGAAVSGLRAGSSVAGLAGDTSLAGGLSSAAGYLAAPLALYNFGKNWQSGATGSDALNGAEAGAAVGSIIPVVGTAIGALIGGAVGALSSAFGGGKKDPETTMAQSITAASGTAAGQQQAQAAFQTPSTAFQYLSGIMDAKNNTPGHSEPIEQVFGRMQEGPMVQQMTQQINSALTSGQVSKNATPQQIYSQVVEPWLTSKGASIDTTTSEGADVASSLEGLIGSWQGGGLTASTPVGVSGQTLTGLQAYGG